MSQVQLLPSQSVSLPPLLYKGQPVCTTEMLAEVYGCTPKNIQDNFANNRDRFVEGKHFIVITSADLKEFRLHAESFGLQISSKTRHLTLWLERGAARNAKMLNSDRAWDVFELLEETFFRVAKAEPVGDPDTLPSPLSRRTDPERKQLTAIINSWVGLAPIHYANARAQVNAHFGVTGVDKLTVAQVKEAIAWVQGKIDALPAPEQLALPTHSTALDEQAQSVQPLMNEVRQRGSEFMSSIFTLQSALRFRPTKMNPAVPDLSKALERTLPQFATSIGMSISALSDLLDVYSATLAATE